MDTGKIRNPFLNFCTLQPLPKSSAVQRRTPLRASIADRAKHGAVVSTAFNDRDGTQRLIGRWLSAVEAVGIETSCLAVAFRI